MAEVGSDQQKILAAMAVVAIFATVGEYARTPDLTRSQAPGVAGPLPATAAAKPDAFKVLLGAGLAAVVLIGVAELGPAAASFAMGLAVIAALTATLVNGKPVWDLISRLVGSPAGSSRTTAPTAATTPTAPI